LLQVACGILVSPGCCAARSASTAYTTPPARSWSCEAADERHRSFTPCEIIDPDAILLSFVRSGLGLTGVKPGWGRRRMRGLHSGNADGAWDLTEPVRRDWFGVPGDGLVVMWRG